MLAVVCSATYHFQAVPYAPTVACARESALTWGGLRKLISSPKIDN